MTISRIVRPKHSKIENTGISIYFKGLLWRLILLSDTKIVWVVICMFPSGPTTALTAGSIIYERLPFITILKFRRCIYILDHHCFFLGHCVGRKNQKFFLVFCLYASIGCLIGVYHVFYTLNNYRVFWSKVIQSSGEKLSTKFSNPNYITGYNFLLPPLLHGYDLHWQSAHCGDAVRWLPQLWIWLIPDDLVPVLYWSGQHCQGKQQLRVKNNEVDRWRKTFPVGEVWKSVWSLWIFSFHCSLSSNQ